MKISLGPAPFNWGVEKLRSFYREIADAPLDRVFIGEVFCEKRNNLGVEELKNLMRPLQEKGKEVYFSTGTIITNGDQWERLMHCVEVSSGIEVNTLGVFSTLREGKKLVAGPFLNLYNHSAVQFLERFDLAGVVLPFELSLESITSIISKVKTPVEIVAYGNLPLGVSWRCYVARSYNLGVEECQFKCMQHNKGIMAENLDGTPLFLINGPYVLSARKRCLVRELEQLKAMGVSSIRIMPHYEHTSKIVTIFRQAMDMHISLHTAFTQLSQLEELSFSNGWFHGEAGWKYITGDHEVVKEDSNNLLPPLCNIC